MSNSTQARLEKAKQEFTRLHNAKGKGKFVVEGNTLMVLTDKYSVPADSVDILDGLIAHAEKLGNVK